MNAKVLKALAVAVVLGAGLLMGSALLTGGENTGATQPGAESQCAQAKTCPLKSAESCCDAKKEAGCCPAENPEACPSECPGLPCCPKSNPSGCPRTQDTAGCPAEKPTSCCLRVFSLLWHAGTPRAASNDMPDRRGSKE
jgi:hypothetical protein